MTMLAPAAGQEESGPVSGPDFRHVRHWLFDLDNTLYRADCGIFSQIERRMTDYVARFLGLPREEARLLQKALYRSHGTTMNGLMRLHGADPDDYLAYVHDIDLSALAPDPALNAVLARLPGQRTIFTNGCRHHAARILERIGAGHLFHAIWDIRTLGFVPKPDPAAYAHVAAAGLEPKTTAMFDDIAHNLAAARALGMTTVWLDTGSDFSSGAGLFEAPHYQTRDLPQFLNSIRI
ncbi:MAG: pyrimidine 5'-nucleotidase [Alphaproteobacteria bacterium]|nr:pyrimidine 5'-nucleotidase [Alphaproteobacteria bacterium]